MSTCLDGQILFITGDVFPTEPKDSKPILFLSSFQHPVLLLVNCGRCSFRCKTVLSGEKYLAHETPAVVYYSYVCELTASATNLEHGFSAVRDPSYDHVRVWHLSVGRQSESNPARCLDSNSERYGFHCVVEFPVELVETSVFGRVEND